MKKLCYRVTVPTTNAAKDTFTINGHYYDCRDGEVFVIAESIAQAAAMMPDAEAIDFIGFAFERRD